MPGAQMVVRGQLAGGPRGRTLLVRLGSKQPDEPSHQSVTVCAVTVALPLQAPNSSPSSVTNWALTSSKVTCKVVISRVVCAQPRGVHEDPGVICAQFMGCT